MAKTNEQQAGGKVKPEYRVADAIRKITTAMEDAVGKGRRSSRIDAYDLIEILLAVADELDPI